LALAWRNSEPTVRFLSAWILVTFGIFSFYATKLPHYVMPCYPAVFLLIGRALDRAVVAGRAARIWDVALRGVIGFAILLLIIAAAAAYRRGPWPMGAVALAGGALLLAGLMLIPGAVIRPTFARCALAATLLISGTEGLARGLRAINPTLRILPALAHLPPDAPCGFSGYREPSVVFYTNRRWTTLEEGEHTRAFARASGPRALLVRLREQRLEWRKPRAPNAELQAWFESLGDKGYTLTRVDGWNAARSSRVTLGIAVRPGDPPYVE
jgi:4-amino-4-deoxy-L-arabinose transferase-like glycosyltransferase